MQSLSRRSNPPGPTALTHRATAARAPRLRLRRLTLALAAGSLFTAGLAPALAQSTLPSGLSVAAGQAQVAVNGNRMTVVNTPQAILNWQTFSIGAGSAVHFQQANAVSSLLNRVTGNDPSTILGSLSSNGRVWLLNPNGVLFGANARVDVAGLVTSTLRLNDSDFLAGRYSFSAGNPNAEVLNQGELRSSFGGTIALLGDSVRNEGTVQADGGQIILAAGKSIELVDTGAPNLGVRITADAGAARNLGTLQAAGGRIDIHAAAVNSSGIVSADGFATGPGGEIWIKASGTTELTAGSRTSANSTNDKAGSVVLLGQNVGLLGDAQVRADGATGGGNVNVGGGLKGQDPRFPNAQAVYFGPQARISADATGSGTGGGNGGQIILWSDQSTRAYGSLSARGGLLGGNGGFIETSGGWLDAQPAKVDTTGPMGRNGEWLLDPWDIEIVNTGTNTVTPVGTTFTASGSNSVITAQRLMEGLLTANVTVSTGSTGSETGRITMNGAQILTLVAPSSLTLQAAGGITITGGASVDLGGGGSINLNAGTGAIRIEGNSKLLVRNTASITLGGTGSGTLPAGGTFTGAAQGTGFTDGVGIVNSTVDAAGGTLQIRGLSAGLASGIRLNNAQLNGAVINLTAQAAVGNGISVDGASSINASSQLTVLGNAAAQGVDLTSGALAAPAITIEGKTAGAAFVGVRTGGGFSVTGTSGLVSISGSGTPNTAAISLGTSTFASSGGGVSITAQGSGNSVELTGAAVTLTNNAGLNLRAAAGVTLSSATINSASGGITLSADNGPITVLSNSTLSASNGSLNLGGSSSVTTASGNTTGAKSVLIDSGSRLSAGDTISLAGVMDGTGAGVAVLGGSTVQAGTVQVRGQSTSSGDGVTISGNSTLTGSASANIEGQSATGRGVFVNGGNVSLGRDLATITGVSTGATAGAGVALQNAALSASGTLKLVGSSANTASPGVNDGVYILDSTLAGPTIDIQGTSSTGSGVQMLGSASALQAGNGLTVVGTGGWNGVQLMDGVVTKTGVGATTITGTSVGNNGRNGVYLNALTVTNTNNGAGFTINGAQPSAGQPIAVQINNSTFDLGESLTVRASNPDNLILIGGGGTNITARGGLVIDAGSSANSQLIVEDSRITVNAVPGELRGSYQSYTGANTFTAANTELRLMQANTGAPSRVFFENTGTMDMVISGTGRWVIFATDINSPLFKPGNLTADFKRYGATGAASWAGDIGNGFASRSTVSATFSGAALGRVYDATKDIAFDNNGALASGGFTGDKATGQMADQNVGLGKTVAVGIVDAAGKPVYGYNLNTSNATLSVDITKRALSVSGLSVPPRDYNGTITATLTGTASAGPELIANDVVTFTDTLTATFNDKNIGTNKPVTVSGATLGGADGGNYSLIPLALTGTITPLPVPVQGLTVPGKVYNGTTAATVTGTPTLQALPGDQLTVGGTLTAAFASKNVGPAVTVAVNGLVFGGADLANYSPTAPLLSAAITAAPLKVLGLSGQSKIYDGTTSLIQNGIARVEPITGDAVGLTGAAGVQLRFADKNAGTNKPLLVTGAVLTGTDAGNYTLDTTGLTASISPRALGVSGLTASGKVYDGSTQASVQGTPAVSGSLIAGDLVELTGTASGSFVDRNAGNNKVVEVSGLALIGADATNYGLSAPALSASITPRNAALTGLTVANKVYDGNATAALGGTAVVNVLPGDRAELTVSATQPASARFIDKNVGTAKPVTVSGYSLSGADASNYELTLPALAANITPLALTPQGLAITPKVYDASLGATLAGAVTIAPLPGDAVRLSGTAVARFVDKNVGTAKPVQVTGLTLSGADAGNYSLAPTLATQGAITVRPLALSGLAARDKTYDGNTGVALSGSASVTTLSGDAVTLSGTGQAQFADKDAASGKPVTLTGYTLAGADAPNYALVLPTLTATVLPLAVQVQGLSAQSKVYDSNTSATLLGTASVQALPGDALQLTGTALARFADRNVASGKPVTVSGLSLSGADATNYSLVLPSGLRADISPRDLPVQGLTATGKVYDGSSTASLAGSAGVSPITGDAVNLLGTPQASFANRDAGTDKPVSVSGLSLAGADAGNYRLVLPGTLRANITPAGLQYLATPVEILAGEALGPLTGTVTGFVSGDTLVSATTGLSIFTTFLPDLSAVGSYAITGSGLSAVNYTFTQAPGNATALVIRPLPADTLTPLLNGPVNAVVSAAAETTKASTTAVGSLLLASPTLSLRPESGVLDLGAGAGAVSAAAAQAVSSTSTSSAAGSAAAAPSFGAVRLSSLSTAQVSTLLGERQAYTRELFSESTTRLELNPNLADLVPCASVEAAASGRCLITPELKARMLAATNAAATAAGAAAAAAVPLSTQAAAVRSTATDRVAQLQAKQRKVKTAALPQIERKIALVLGVGTYQDSSIPSLANATRDSDAVAQVLETQLGYETVVLNNASKAEVVAAMNRIALTAGPRDSVIVYYAGHGELIETTKQGYWLLADSEAKKPETWLSNADINRLVGQIGASQVALISDSCYSGTLASDERIRATPTALDPKAVLDRKSVVVMSSGGNQPVADDGRDGHSPFAWHLMDVIGKVDNWQAGGNIFERVRFAVAKALPQRPQYSASRSAGHQAGGDYLFEQRRLDTTRP